MTTQAEPYTMYTEDSEALSGNARFEGYSVDLIKHIADILSEDMEEKNKKKKSIKI